MVRLARGQLALAAGFLLLHFALRPLLVEWPGAPDLLTGGLLLAALRIRPAGAAGLGFGIGLLEGSMALEGLGMSMIVYTVAGYAAARSRDLIFTDARVFVPVYLFAGTWSVQAAIFAASGADAPVETLLLLGPVSAVLTTAVCWTGLRAFSPYPY